MIRANWFGEWSQEEKEVIINTFSSRVLQHTVGLVISQHENKRAVYLYRWD